ncbi:hypothetical protein SAMN06269185_2679 [Natronoarchaeum philippinense]|uniref:Uncharacterized protein n=1 Tax=Natronoarchaeum philippinense TaxID=558529 RepID=A0A285P2R6_NATPI|nr:hypothetical protein [Natronoarchaeum philippinense]SNZ16034.1 hypothetical protein SAMN06269185_2679 [Natronoarchaeum philippinense]
MNLDPFFVVLVAAFVGLFFFLFLLVRRTMLSFKEGMDNGR